MLADRLREYVPDIPKDMEAVVMVRYSGILIQKQGTDHNDLFLVFSFIKISPA